MRSRYYVFDDHGEPIPARDFAAWFSWCARTDRTIAETHILRDDVRISTIFIGIDYGFPDDPNATTALWETTISGLPGEDEEQSLCWRYASREKAFAGHRAAVAYAHAALRSDGRLLVRPHDVPHEFRQRLARRITRPEEE